MDSEIESIFDEAVNAKDAQERSEVIERRCRENTDLRRRVERLLKAYDRSEHLDFEEISLFSKSDSIGDLQGKQVGEFNILHFLGEGGMGEVYAARRADSTDDLVAIKVIKLGMDTRQVVARFDLERKTLQSLVHPNIASFIASGVTQDGRAYFVMELVRGLPITEYCDRFRLGILERVKLFVSVCEAIGHAHQRGIVHRDVKPNNILVTRINDRSVVKVIDFGIAKALTKDRIADSVYTGSMQWLGTPNYMSPEQTKFSSDVDTRSDVYSLGCILYELLCGTTPIRQKSLLNLDLERLHLKINESDFPYPSHRVRAFCDEERTMWSELRSGEFRPLLRSLNGDLDNISRKAIEKDRNARYVDANGLAEDLRAHMENRPVLAHTPSLWTRLQKGARRHRVPLSVASFLTLILMTIVVTSFIVNYRSQFQTRIMENNSPTDAESRRIEFVSLLQRASALFFSGDTVGASNLLSSAPVVLEEFEDHFAVNYLISQGKLPHSIQVGLRSGLLDMEVSCDGRWLVSCDRSGEIVLWDLSESRESIRISSQGKEVTRVRFSPDGKNLAAAGQDRLVRVWSTEAWNPVAVFEGHETTINGLAWSPDSLQIASGDRDGTVRIWNLKSKECERKLPQHSGPVRCLEWTNNGRALASSDGDVGVHVWDCSNWKRTTYKKQAGGGILAMAISKDCRYLAFGGYGAELVVVDLVAKNVIQRTQRQNAFWSLVFSPDLDLIAGRGNGQVEVFLKSSNDVWYVSRLLDVSKLDSTIRSIFLSTDGSSCFVGSELDRAVVCFDLSKVLGFERTTFERGILGIEPERDCMFSIGANNTTLVHQLNNRDVMRVLEIRGKAKCPPVYSRKSNRVALPCIDEHDNYVTLIRPDDWVILERIPFPSPVQHLSFSRDGQSLLVAGVEVPTQIVDLVSKNVETLGAGKNDWNIGEFSPTEDLIVCGPNENREITCFDAKTFQAIRSIQTRTNWRSLRFHPAGEFIVVGETGRFSVWTPDLSEQLWTGRLSIFESDLVLAIDFSQDLQTMAIMSRRGGIGLWDLATRTQIYSIPFMIDNCYWLRFASNKRLFWPDINQSKLFSLNASRVGNP